MDYKQKYEEALEMAKVAALNGHQNLMEEIFPELAESEDEKVRKDIKRAISVALDYSYFDKETADNCLAWLEKQGETKETDYGESEDEKIINEIINTVIGNHPTHSSKETQRMINWLEQQKSK